VGFIRQAEIEEDDIMDKAIRDQIISIIDDVDDLTLATIREDGYPQATTVSYMNDGMTIYFMSSSDSQKAENLAKTTKVSLTINRPYESWNDIESVSIGGDATAVTDPAEQQKIGELLLKKFPQAAAYEPEDSSGGLAFFRIEPKVVSLLDYGKGFGHTELYEV
jgi:nitroimidazol reductase NimA-like FMN-containing flavoprotein (pyridoxamine 5'-phosphate oxidase superfamily)